MFTFGGLQLRGVKIDGEPWFVAADACRCLGLTLEGGSGRHTYKLDADERQTFRKGVNGNTTDPSIVALFGQFDSVHVFISRPGLFKLIARSSKPEAKKFDRWVRHEVLPQLMDNGGYLMPDADVAKVAEAASNVEPIVAFGIFETAECLPRVPGGDKLR